MPDTTGSENTQAVQLAAFLRIKRFAAVRYAWMGRIRSTSVGPVSKRGDLSSFRLCRAKVSRPTIKKLDWVASSELTKKARAEDDIFKR